MKIHQNQYEKHKNLKSLLAKDDGKPVIHRRGTEIRDKQRGKLRPAQGEAETVGVGRLGRAWGRGAGVPSPVVFLGLPGPW